MIYLILAYMVVCPLSYWIGVDLRTIQEIVFQCSSLILITAGLIVPVKNYEFNKLDIGLLSLLVLMVILYLSNSFMGVGMLMNTFLGIGVYLTIARHITKQDFKLIFNTGISIALFAILYFILQCLGYDIRNQQQIVAGGIPKCSFFGIEHAFGMYLGMVMPFILALGGVFSIIIAPIVLVCAIFSKSTGAMVGTVSGVLFFYWFNKRLAFWMLLIPILAGLASYIVLYDNPMGMQKSRFMMWSKVIQDVHIKPLGYGLDAFRNDEREGSRHYFKYPYSDKTLRVIKENGQWIMERDNDPQFDAFLASTVKNKLDFWDNAHNVYINTTYEAGIPGFAIICFILWSVWRRFWTSKKNVYAVATMSSLVAISIFGGTQFPFNIARLAHLIPIILGMFVVSTGDNFGKNHV